MSDPLLTAADRDRLREFTAAAAPERLANGARLADQLRGHLDALPDEAISAAVAVCAQVATTYSAATGCGHVLGLSALLKAAACDLANLELDEL